MPEMGSYFKCAAICSGKYFCKLRVMFGAATPRPQALVAIIVFSISATSSCQESESLKRAEPLSRSVKRSVPIRHGKHFPQDSD